MFPLVMPAAKRGKSSTMITHVRTDTQTHTWSHFYVTSGCSSGRMLEQTSADDCSHSSSQRLTGRAIAFSSLFFLFVFN